MTTVIPILGHLARRSTRARPRTTTLRALATAPAAQKSPEPARKSVPPFPEPASLYPAPANGAATSPDEPRHPGDDAWRTYSPFYESESEFASRNVRQVSTAVTLRQLMAAGLHLGHAPEELHPRMLPYVYGERHHIHVINLEHTLAALRTAIGVVREVAVRRGYIVFVGTKPVLHRIVVEAARRCAPVGFFVTDWKRGIITNRSRVLRRSVGYDPDKVGQRRVDLHGGQGGSFGASRPPFAQTPDMLVFLDTPNLQFALNEANLANIPVVALCDTNVDPSLVQYPIPGNDDALPGLELVAGVLSMAAREGHEARLALQRQHRDKSS